MTRRPIPLACTLLFVLIASAFFNRTGIQNDEALFGSGIYRQVGITDGIKIAGHRIPLMLISYLGALKSWVYAPIFRFWKPSTASLRVPVILAGGLTIWLFWSLMLRIADYRAAVTACGLLASDSLFAITTCLDWGPVVLQHLLLVSGLLCLVRFHQDGPPRFLAAGFFLFGLAFWDKALFGWIGSGMGIATVLVYPRELRKYLSARHLTIAILAFSLGAAPLITYNIRHPLETFRANASYSFDDVPGKLRLLHLTLTGESLFGYIPRDDPAGHPRDPQGAIERASIWISEKTGAESSFFYQAIIAAAILLPWLWFTEARRILVFSALAMSIAWLQMLAAKNAGGSVHHLILLWPFPALFTGVAFAQASRRMGWIGMPRIGMPLLTAALALVIGSNLLVTNEYLARLIRNGPSVTWTDAIYPLSDCLARVKASTVYIDDWGMFDNLWTMSRGRLPLRVGMDPLSNVTLTEDDRRVILGRIAETGSIFVGHTEGNEAYPGVNARLRSIAGEAGYRQEMIAEIPDRNGRAIFEVVRFVKAR